jgi:homoserine O-acetyltransferase
VQDIVDANVRLLDHLGIRTLLGVVGASMGGFCVLDMAARYPRRVRLVIPIATGLRATVLAKAFNFEQILAIEEDRHFNGGDYYEGPRPLSGLILARIISHKTFVSLSLMESRARREIVQPDDVLSGYQLQHQIESYLLHQGKKFVKRFDANTYLRIVNAWQSFDLPQRLANGSAADTFSRCHGQTWLIFSISSDVCFYPEEQTEIADALKANRIEHQHITVHSEKGHDSFLIEPDLYAPYVDYKLKQMHRQIYEAPESVPEGSRDGDFAI